jgi:hypothetical protein
MHALPAHPLSPAPFARPCDLKADATNKLSPLSCHYL